MVDVIKGVLEKIITVIELPEKERLTKFMVSNPKELRFLSYKGIILPDSIGHNVKVYITKRSNEPERVTKIYDENLKREYSIFQI